MADGPERKEARRREIEGVILGLGAIVLAVALASFNAADADMLVAGRQVKNLIGPFGAWLSGHLRGMFGLSAFFIPLLLALAAWEMARSGKLGHIKEKIVALVYMAVVFAPLIALIAHGANAHSAGGWFGNLLVVYFQSVFGTFGMTLLVLALNLLGLILLGVFSLSGLIENMKNARKPFADTIGKAAGLMAKFRKNNAPLNNLEEVIRRRQSGRLPWITKKKIRLMGNQYERAGASVDGPVRLIPMQNPVYDGSGGDGYVYHHYSEANHSLFNSPTMKTHNDEHAENSVPLLEEHTSVWDEWMASRPVREALSVEVMRGEAEPRSRITGIEREADDAILVDCEEAVEKSGAYGLDDGFDEDGIEDEELQKKEMPDDAAEASEMPHVFEEILLSKEYGLPVKYLVSSQSADSETFQSEIRRNSELLVNTLRDFGIESRVVKVNRGPVITLYEMQIAPGIKVNRIVALADDIAMALAASRVRVVAPIPGKSAVGIEVPNLNREMVTLGDIIKSPEYSLIPGKLKVALGKDILGNPVTLDIKKLPHLLIAGATGSGKSVLVNTIITSLVYNYDPNHVRFILVDPKMVELQLYNGLPHLLTPVITEPHVAPRALKWATLEMERRYRLLSAMNTRDIDRYNERAEKMPGCERLPYIVIIMDELADLMMVAAKEIEGFITRIAQKARAVGIHLVLATQRPSVDVITGIIKANFPARIAFQVAQKTDSRTIIDQNGAEKLLGKGDMLYQSPMSSFPIRIQGAFISEDEVIAIVQHLRRLAAPHYIDIEEELFEQEEDDDFGGEEDELFQEALRIVAETKKASASYLQRRLSIGYNRAARMIELMEEKGLIGPQQGSKPREVYL